MAKQGGMGDRFFLDGYNISGDLASLSRVGGGPAAMDMTDITQSGYERQGGLLDGSMEFNVHFNDATGREHPVLKTLPTTVRIGSYFRGTTLGGQCASMVARQANYDWTRGQDGALSGTVQLLADAYGIEWGRSLTAGVRSDTAATNGSSIDTTASASFGAQFYLHVFAFTGTDVTVKVQDSADNSSWLDLAGAAFTQVTSAPTAERVALGSTATVRRYLRVVTATTGGFSALDFAVQVTKNDTTVSL